MSFVRCEVVASPGRCGSAGGAGSASEAKLRGRASRVRSFFCGIPLAQHPGPVHGGTSKQRLHTGGPHRRLHAGRECPGVAQGFGRANGRETRRVRPVRWLGAVPNGSMVRARTLLESMPRESTSGAASAGGRAPAHRPHRVSPIPDEARSRELTGDH